MKKQMAKKLTREEKKEIRSMFTEIPKRKVSNNEGKAINQRFNF